MCVHGMHNFFFIKRPDFFVGARFYPVRSFDQISRIPGPVKQTFYVQIQNKWFEIFFTYITDDYSVKNSECCH